MLSLSFAAESRTYPWPSLLERSLRNGDPALMITFSMGTVTLAPSLDESFNGSPPVTAFQRDIHYTNRKDAHIQGDLGYWPPVPARERI